MSKERETQQKDTPRETARAAEQPDLPVEILSRGQIAAMTRRPVETEVEPSQPASQLWLSGRPSGVVGVFL